MSFLKKFATKIRKAQNRPLDDYEYLLHHIEVVDGVEETHHCLVYDHVGNMFEQANLTVKDGKVFINGEEVKEGTFHVIKGLEPNQEVVWSDEEAKENGIRPKQMRAGMTKEEKSKEW